MYYAPRRTVYLQVTLPTVFGLMRLLRCILLRERITLVHAHQAFSPMAHEAILHARTMGCRVVFTDHSLFGFADVASILTNKALKFTAASVHQVLLVPMLLLLPLVLQVPSRRYLSRLLHRHARWKRMA